MSSSTPRRSKRHLSPTNVETSGMNKRPAVTPATPPSPPPSHPYPLPNALPSSPSKPPSNPCNRVTAWNCLTDHHLALNDGRMRKFNRVYRGENFTTGNLLDVEDANLQKKQLIMSELAWILKRVFKKNTQQMAMDDSVDEKKFIAVVDLFQVFSEYFTEISEKFQARIKYLQELNPQEFLMDEEDDEQ